MEFRKNTYGNARTYFSYKGAKWGRRRWEKHESSNFVVCSIQLFVNDVVVVVVIVVNPVQADEQGAQVHRG